MTISNSCSPTVGACFVVFFVGNVEDLITNLLRADRARLAHQGACSVWSISYFPWLVALLSRRGSRAGMAETIVPGTPSEMTKWVLFSISAFHHRVSLQTTNLISFIAT
jgi:hypothetical protein